MNSRQRYRAKRMSKFNAETAERKSYARRVNNAYERLSTGCSERTAKALSLPSLREPKHVGSSAIPGVAIYHAGHRAVRKDATHIIK